MLRIDIAFIPPNIRNCGNDSETRIGYHPAHHISHTASFDEILHLFGRLSIFQNNIPHTRALRGRCIPSILYRLEALPHLDMRDDLRNLDELLHSLFIPPEKGIAAPPTYAPDTQEAENKRVGLPLFTSFDKI